jgi:hypothetical protein
VRGGVRPQPRTFGVAIRGIRDVGDGDIVPAADELDLGARFTLDARCDGRVGEPTEKGLRALIAAPYRKEIRQSGLIRDVRIPVERGVDPGLACRGNPIERDVELLPVPRALRFEM